MNKEKRKVLSFGQELIASIIVYVIMFCVTLLALALKLITKSSLDYFIVLSIGGVTGFIIGAIILRFMCNFKCRLCEQKAVRVSSFFFVSFTKCHKCEHKEEVDIE